MSLYIFREIPPITLDENTTDGQPFDDYPVDRSCHLLGPTALIVQALMGVLVLLSLIYKRQRETPKRPWQIWLFDVSKQIAGQMFVHGVNVFISDIGSHHSSGNACVFYFLNILIDTTLGVALLYFILHFAAYVLTKKFQLEGFESGQYGTPPSVAFWLRQAAVYVFALTSMKLSVVLLFAIWPGILEVGSWLLSWTNIGEGDAFQVIFAMGIFPIFMNILQFWLIDSIVKASSSTLTLPTASPRNSDNPDREPLFRASSSDEDDNIPGHLHRDVEYGIRSRSQSVDGAGSTAEEGKSNPSGLVTPIDIAKNASMFISKHDYPPSIAGSSISSRASRGSSSSLRKYKRSPPPPLNFKLPRHPASNSPDPSARRLSNHAPTVLPVSDVADADSKSKDDSSWEVDDWATRVGEEEWNGRRLEESKEMVNDAWNTPSVRQDASNVLRTLSTPSIVRAKMNHVLTDDMRVFSGDLTGRETLISLQLPAG